MTQVLRIALPGKDVFSGKPGEMVLDSRYAVPKINTQATPPHAGTIFLNFAEVVGGYPDGTLKVLDFFPHGYNQIPTVFANYFFDGGSRQVNGMLPFQYGAMGMIFMDTDEVNVNLKYYSFDGSPPIDIPAFLMQIRFYVMAEAGY